MPRHTCSLTSSGCGSLPPMQIDGDDPIWIRRAHAATVPPSWARSPNREPRIEQCGEGVRRYVILGAGLDSFPSAGGLTSKLACSKSTKRRSQDWKRQRLLDLGLEIPENLQFVAMDFEAKDSWWEMLATKGFKETLPAVVASTGVSMYLTKEANQASLRQLSRLAPGSTLAMSFLLPWSLSTVRTVHNTKWCMSARAGRHSVCQLLSSARDLGDGARSRVSRRPTYFQSRSRSALLRQSNRWPSAFQWRRVPDRNELSHPCRLHGAALPQDNLIISIFSIRAPYHCRENPCRLVAR